jgi:hypothetical protein
MKKSILFVAMLSLMATSFAQNNNNNSGNNFFSLKNDWTKIIGYSYQPGYPYGISLAGGSFLSIGWAEEGARYDISANEYREPTWSLRCGWIGYTFDEENTGLGAISFRPMLVLGIDKTKDVINDPVTNIWTKESNTYFTMAPTIVINLWMIHFSVGYEFVPKFKDLNGINFGIGLSIPSSTTNKWTEKAKTYQQNRTNKNNKK